LSGIDATIFGFFLKAIEISEKTQDDWVNIANNFRGRTQFPNCMGAVDGKHVRMKMPFGSRSLLYYNKHVSILLLALVDADCCLIAVAIVANGDSSESNVFKNSKHRKEIGGESTWNRRQHAVA
jgi:hypothetical protein